MTAPRAREQADPPSSPDRRPPRRGGGSSPRTYAASAASRRVAPVARHGLVRSARALAAAALLALTGGLFLPASAEAQTVTTLVSNTGQGDFTENHYRAVSQRFDTGSNEDGYTLTGVDVVSASSTGFTAQVCGVDSDLKPTSTCTDLTAPGTFAVDTMSFTAPADIPLTNYTTYAVVVTALAANIADAAIGETYTGVAQGWGITYADGEDADPAAGWSLSNSIHIVRQKGTLGSWDSEDLALRIAIKGAAGGGTLSTDATLSALSLGSGVTLSPTFASGTATYTALVANSVDEVTVTATENHASADVEIQDADGNALVDAGTAAGHQVALVEGENVIKVKVTAGNGMATQTYTVTVTRSAVDAPDAPTGFSATKGNRYVTLAWNAPASGANITHHEYHYKTDGSYPDDWKTIPHSATGGFNEDGFTVTKLTNDTAHTFELRAVNAGGGSTAVESSAVTPSGSGRIVESIGVRRDDGQDGDPHGVGDEIRFVVKFSSNVPCASTTSRVVQFNLGSATKDADGYAGDGTSSLWYRYTVLEGDVDSDGIEIPAGPQALPHEYFANNGCTEEFDETGIKAQGPFPDRKVDGVYPSVDSAAVNGAELVLTWDETLRADSLPVAGDFAVTVTGSSRDVSSVAVAGSAVTLTLASAVERETESIFVSYTPGSTASDRLKDLASNDAPAVSNQQVTNNTPDTTPPAITSAQVSASGTLVRLEFGEDVFGTEAPAEELKDAFSVTVNSAARTITSIGNVGRRRVTLGVDPVIYKGRTVTVGYDQSAAGANALDDAAGNKVVSFEDFAVTNESTQEVELNFSAAPGDGQVVLSWEAPASGSGVTRHEYRQKEGTGSYPANFTQIPNSGEGGANEAGYTVTGLTNETVYTFELRSVAGTTEGTASESDAVTPTPGICGRTPQVRDALLELTGVEDCKAVTVADLAGVTFLNISMQALGVSDITALKSGDFGGLTGLTKLTVADQQGLTTLPSDIFSGLSKLTTLGLISNQLNSLPSNVFSDLTKLTALNLRQNKLTSLPSNVFSDLTKLEELGLGENELTSPLPAGLFDDWTALETLSLDHNELSSLPAGLFDDPTALETLRLNNNKLSSLPPNVFSGLAALEILTLSGNDLTSLPDGLFSGLTALTTLYLSDNPNTGDTLALTVTVEKFGTDQARAKVPAGAPAAVAFTPTVVDGSLPTGVTTLSVAAGSVDGTAVTVTRTTGTVAAVTVDIDLTTQPTLPTNHTGYEFAKATSGLPATILPDTRSPQNFTAKPGDGQAVLSWTAPASGSGVTRHDYRYKSGTGSYPATWEDIPNSAAGEANEDGYTVPNLTNETVYTFELRTVVGTTEGTASESDPVTPTPGICDRTQQVRDGILAELADVAECEAVTVANLAGIGRLDLDDKGIASLKAGDFAGLTGMTTLILNDNDLTSLPAGVFSGLTALSSLFLVGNDLSSLPANVFSGLTSLGNINLRDNDLSSLPANVFSGLTSLWNISLRDNDLSSLPATVFSGLTSLINIDLLNNDLTSLPDGLFSGLTGLEDLVLGANPNSGDELPLTVTLEKVGEDRVRAKVPTGAPFAVAIPVTPANGTLAGGVTMLTVAAGSVESAAVTVTRTEGTTAAVTVDVDLTNQPSLPPFHLGYFFARAPSGLPAVILPEEASLEPPTALRATPGDREAVLAWTPPASDSGFTRHQYRYRTTGDFVEDWTRIPDSGPGGANGSRYTVTGLANAVEHTFELRARDAGVGKSDAATVKVTPAGPPRIVSVEVTSGPALDNGTTYGVREEIRISVTFDQPVEVTGDPQLALDVGGPRLAEYHSGGGSETLVFVYVVRASDDDEDGVSVGDDALRLDGNDGIDNGAGDGAELAHDGPGAQPGHMVDGTRRAGVHTHAEFTHSHADSRERYPEHTHEGHEHPDKANDHSSGMRPGQHVHHEQARPHQAVFLGPDLRGHGNVEHTHLCYDLKPSCNQGDDYAERGDELGLPIEVTHSHEDSEPGHHFDWTGWFEEGGSGATVSVADAEAARGEDATLDFEVTLDPAVAFAVQVDYATADGTATAGEDYRETASVLEIPPGETRATVRVRILEDAPADGDETLTLTLGSATAATVAAAEATGTILTPAPTTQPVIERIGVASTPRLSSRGATNRDTYGEGETIRIEVRFDQPVVVEGAPTFALEVGNPCLAVCEADYESGSGTDTLVFAYLVLEVDIDGNGIAIRGNPIELADGATISNAADQDADVSSKGKGTQRNHKVDGSRAAASHLSVEDAEAHEADGEMAFTVRLEPRGLGIVRVDYATADGTGSKAARAGSDYTETSGTLTFDPLETARTVTVPITDDDDEEDDGETFTLTLSNPRGAEIAAGGDDEATGTIRNSEPQEALTASFEDVPAAHDGSKRIGVRVRFNAPVDASEEEMAEHGVQVQGGRVHSAGRVPAEGDGGGAREMPETGDEHSAGRVPAEGDGGAPREMPETGDVHSAGRVPAEGDGKGPGTHGAKSTSPRPGSEESEESEESGEVVWQIEIEPDGDGDVTVSIEAGRPCDEEGAICTADGRSLSEGISTTVEGPETGPALTAAFEGMPEAHDGESAFTFRVAFSEDIGISFRSLREDAFEVAGGRVTRGVRVDDRRDLFEMTVEPDGEGEVTVTLPAGRECAVSGAICTKGENRRQLTNTPTATVAGPEVETAGPALTARFENMPAAHDGEGAFTFRVAFSENIGISYRSLREDAFEVSGGRVTRGERVDDRRDLFEMTVEPDGGSAVTVTLPAGRECSVSGAICTKGENRRQLTNTPTATVAGPEVGTAGPALTASFVDMPSEHDGKAFKLRIAFSEEIRMSGRRLRSDVVAVSGGRATKAGRVNRRKDLWKLTVRPDSLAAVTVTLAGGAACDTPAAVCTADGKALSGTVSTTVRGPVALSVADARAREGKDPTLDFAVSLSRASSGRVTVDYATVDGSAKAGADYEATSGTLSFAPGETAKTVAVAVLDDAHDEGTEVLVLRLENARGARLGDRLAVGRIENMDHMPAAWLARFGRTVTDQVLDAVEARLAAPRAAGTRVRLAGQALPFRDGAGDRAKAAANDNAGAGDNASGRAFQADARDRAFRADARDREAVAAIRDWLAQAGTDGPGSGSGADDWRGEGAEGRERSRALTGLDFVTGTSFELTGGSAEAGGYAALWGRGALSRFDGREGDLTLDGEVTTGLIGADWAAAPGPGSGAGRWSAGLAVGHARGTGSYSEGGNCTDNDGSNGSGGDGDSSAGDSNDPGASGCSGEVESTLTGLWPYAGFRLTDRLSAWATAGYGAGELTLTPGGETDGPFTADLTMTMGAAGLRGEVLAPPPEGGLALAVKGDTRFTRTQSKATRDANGGLLKAATGDVWLLRLGVEGSRRFALGAEDAGATLTPRFEVGARLDGGDAETGAGADVGAGVTLAAPRHGLMLVLNARGLLAHEASGFRESGASASFTWDPRPGTDRGLALTLRQSWGGSPAGGMDALLGRGTLAGLAADDNAGTASAGRLEAELGYGIALFGGGFTGTPNIGIGLSDTSRDYRLGWRLKSARKGTLGFELGLEATRREAANADAEHGVMLRGAIRW